jgi:hypothetical protein
MWWVNYPKLVHPIVAPAELVVFLAVFCPFFSFVQLYFLLLEELTHFFLLVALRDQDACYACSPRAADDGKSFTGNRVTPLAAGTPPPYFLLVGGFLSFLSRRRLLPVTFSLLCGDNHGILGLCDFKFR